MRASWRRIVVDGETLRWTTSVSRPARGEHGCVEPLIVEVLVRAERRRLAVARFHGWCVEGVFTGVEQSLAIRPGIVAEIVRRTRAGDTTIDHAERVFPDAIVPADPDDAMLRAACSQWFIPYPGRDALAQVLADTGRDFAATAARLSPPKAALTADQIARWAELLGV